MAIKTVVAVLVVLIFASIHLANAQQIKLAKIGWLGNRPDTSEAVAETGTSLRRMLNELGYVEGKNIAFEFRFADNKPDRIPALIDELTRLKVDLIFVNDPNAALAAKNATRTIPIVFLLGVIRLWLGWLTAWRGPEATSLGSLTLQTF